MHFLFFLDNALETEHFLQDEPDISSQTPLLCLAPKSWSISILLGFYLTDQHIDVQVDKIKYIGHTFFRIII